MYDPIALQLKSKLFLMTLNQALGGWRSIQEFVPISLKLQGSGRHSGNLTKERDNHHSIHDYQVTPVLFAAGRELQDRASMLLTRRVRVPPAEATITLESMASHTTMRYGPPHLIPL